LKDAEPPGKRARFRRALLTALRDGDSASGFPALREVCEEIESDAASENEHHLWRRAGRLCSRLYESAEFRSPERLLLFRGLDRVLGDAAPDPDEIGELASELARHLPNEEEGGEASGRPASGISSAMKALSSHPAWEDENVEAAREALACLSGASSAEPVQNGSSEHEDPIPAPRAAALGPRSHPTLDEEGPPTPLSNVIPRLERVLRLGCQNLDRHCVLQMEGSPRIGQGLLKRMIGPLEAIVRNALYFGVAPDRPTTATMTLRMRTSDTHRQIELETDGASPDLARIAMEALQEGAEPGSTSGIELLLDESRSTADHATRLRGYGAGLFEAREALEALGAQLSLELPRDAGLRFVIELARSD